MYSQKDVIEANIQLHTILANKYKETEPHYKSENVKRIDQILSLLKQKTAGESLLDIGCGSGFMIDIAKRYFHTIRGVDITPAMLEAINVNDFDGDLKVMLAQCEDLPFEDNSFDICTAHAVLHHLHNIEPALKEAYRVLKPGGIFYSDLDPNYYFWQAVSKLDRNKEYSDIISRELEAVFNKDSEIEREFGVPRDVFLTAENLKHGQGGFKGEDLDIIMSTIGFSKIQIKYEWFLGEAKIIHSDTTKHAAGIFRDYLHESLPLTRHLFKYIAIYAIK